MNQLSDRCKECRRDVELIWTPAGRPMEIEPAWRKTRPDGNVIVVDVQLPADSIVETMRFAVTLSGSALAEARDAGLELRMPHAAVCNRRKRG